MTIQWVAAVTFSLRGELQVAILAFVAINMKTPVQGHNTNRFLFAGLGHNWFLADTATGGEFFVKVLNAMDLAIC